MLSWWAVAVVLCLPCGLSYHAQRQYEDVEHGQPLVLHCDGSAYRDEEGVVHWEQQGEVVVVLRGEETPIAESLRGRVRLPSEEQMRKGNWSLVISKVTPSDDDLYSCLFNNSILISSVWVRVLENDEATVVDYSTKKPLWTIDGSEIGTTDLPFPMEVSTQTMKVVTDSQLVGTTDKSTPWIDSQSMGTTDKSTPWIDSQSMGTTDKSTPWIDSQSMGTTDKSTPFSDRDNPQVTTDSPLLERFPWVRIGLIGGVLLATLLVMGLLGASGQI